MSNEDQGFTAHEAEVQALNDQLKQTEKAYTQLEEKWKATESQLQEALDDIKKLEAQNNKFVYLDESPVEPFRIEPTKSKTKKELELCPVAMLSDVHPFETVLPERVQYTNKATPSIISRRLQTWAKEVVRRINLRKKGGEYINYLTIALLGDIVGNMLRSEDMKSHAGSVNEEILFMTNELLSVLEYIHEKLDLKQIYVVGVHGNHDRGTPYPEHATLARESHTWVLYHYVKKFIQERTNMNIRVDVAEGYFHTFNVFDYPLRCSHGHSFNYKGGVGGVQIALQKAKRGWDSAFRPYLDLIGHWHTSSKGKGAIVNASVIGYSTFASNKGFDFEPPNQTMIFLNREFGLTGLEHLVLDKKYSDKTKKEKEKDD